MASIFDNPDYVDYRKPIPPLFSDPAFGDAPQSPLIGTPSSTGIGMADTQARAPVEDRSRPTLPVQPSLRDQARSDIQNLPVGQKIGLALREFGAGLNRQPSPTQAYIEEKRKERLLQATELKAHVSALEDGVKIARGLQGDAKKGFVDDYAAQLDQVRPGLGATFKHVSEQPDLLTKFQSYMPYLPDTVKLMMSNDPNAFMQFIAKPEGIKILEDSRNKYNVKIATQQASGTIAHLQQLDLPPDLMKQANETDKMSASLFNKIQDYLPAGHPYKMSPEVRASINEHKDQSDLFYRALGMHSPADEAEIARKQAELKDKLRPGQMTEIPTGGKNFNKVAYDPDKTFFPQAEHDANGFAILGKGTKEGMQIVMPSSTGMGVNPDTGKPGHYTIGKDGELRWDKVEPLPKEGNPIQAAVAKLIAEGGKLGGKVNIIPPEGTAAKLPKADELGIKHKFDNDTSMAGNKLGAKTANGYEVKNSAGKLIGYYR